MASTFFQERLNKLVYGYNNEIVATPNDIATCIISYLQEDKEITFRKVAAIKMYSSDKYTFEIYLSDFLAKVIDYSRNIKKYEIKYISSMKSFESLNDSTDKINERGLAFIDIETQPKPGYSSFSVQAMNEDDECIAESGWIKVAPVLGSWQSQYSTQVVDKYFEDTIDKTGNGYVTMDEWVAVLNEMEEFNEFDVWEKKKMFYFQMYRKLKYAFVNDGIRKEMDKFDFFAFVATEDLDGYDERYQKFIYVFKNGMPDLSLRGIDDSD